MDFKAASLSRYDIGTLYTALPHNLLKDDLIERTFLREGTPYLACNDKKNHLFSCQYVYEALTFLLDNIFIRFGTKLYKQVGFLIVDLLFYIPSLFVGFCFVLLCITLCSF